MGIARIETEKGVSFFSIVSCLFCMLSFPLFCFFCVLWLSSDWFGSFRVVSGFCSFGFCWVLLVFFFFLLLHSAFLLLCVCVCVCVYMFCNVFSSSVLCMLCYTYSQLLFDMEHPGIENIMKAQTILERMAWELEDVEGNARLPNQGLVTVGV